MTDQMRSDHFRSASLRVPWVTPPKSAQTADDGWYYNKTLYWNFLKKAWEGVAPLLAPQARIVVRIGGRKLSKQETLSRLLASLKDATDRVVKPADGGVTTPVKRTQANSFRRPKLRRLSNMTSVFLWDDCSPR